MFQVDPYVAIDNLFFNVLEIEKLVSVLAI